MTRTDPERILVRLPNWVGDAVMATPALRALRRGFPRAELVGEGRAVVGKVVAGLPALDRFELAHDRGSAALVQRPRELRAGGFDLAVLFPDSVRAAVGPFLARIPRRVGYAREPLRRWMLTDVLPPPRDEAGRRVPIPMTERYLALTRLLGCDDASDAVELPLDEAAVASVARRLAAAGLADTPLALVNPGAAFGPSKLYPAASFAAVCDGVREALGLHPVLAPGPGEEPLAREIAAAARGPVTVLDDPVTTLPELVALSDRARLALGTDSGARHIAVARGTPTVTVMGPTDPRHTEYRTELQAVVREDVECSPCHEKRCPIDHRCMVRLAPERVVDAAAELLSSTNAAFASPPTAPAAAR